MYKSAARANPALLKRIKCPSPCAYRLISPKREPHISKPNNAAYQVFGYKAEGFSSGHSARRPHHGSDRAPSLLAQWQKKWLLQASVFNKAGVNYARMFSDKSKGNGNVEKGNSTSSNPSRKQNAREPGCTSRKLSNKKTPEGNGLKRIVESNEGNNATRKEHINVRKTVLDKRKREEACEATVTKSRTQNLEKKMASIEPTAGKSIEESERLQHIQRKIIRSLERKWISWQNISDTLAEFPCDVHENTRDLLLDCIAARVKKHKLSRIGESLSCTSNLILLQGQSGTEFYQEAFVRAIARQLRIALLVADNNTLSAKDLKDESQIAGFAAEGIKQNNNHESLHNGKKESANLQTLRITSSKRTRQVAMSDSKRFKESNTPERILSSSMEEDKNKRLQELEVDKKNPAVTKSKVELQKVGKQGDVFQKPLHNLNIGDDVRYKGPKISKEKLREKVKIGQEGFVTSISHSLPWKLCVKFHGVSEDIFCDAAELEKLNSDVSDEGWLARFPELPIEALCKVVGDGIPVIVHFPDIEQWFSSVNSNGNAWLFPKVKDLLSKIDGPVVFIASSYDKEMNAPVVTHTFMEAMLQQIVVSTVSKDSSPKKKDAVLAEVSNIFRNVIKFLPPNEPNLLSIWKKGLEENKKKVTGTRNAMLLEESLEKNCMTCAELLNLITVDVQLTSETADDVVGWARNMIYQCGQLQTSDGRLIVDKKWLERSLGRLKDLTHTSEDKLSYGLVENEYEKCLVPSVILAHEIGVKFSEIGALEYVKNSLNELIVLPLKRPELFRRGNLRKPCKGVLLFGPPGTGKTLVAKAVATEAGANFLNISAATITSKYYGEDEKLVHAMFSLAKKLRPAVIFVDEVDSILGSRNDATEHEAMRRIKNEFMAAWDGLQSNESEQILVFAATNRPFDLDDAVIRRLPRRIFVDLPNSENRVEILRVILANEDLDSSFSFESLALQTEGYSGSDLKNLCVAAAYVPVREFLAAEQEANKASLPGCCSPQVIRPLCMSDFLSAKTKIGASLAYDASAMVQLRQWNDQYGEGGNRLHKRIGFSQ